jgi:hypothetical protein
MGDMFEDVGYKSFGDNLLESVKGVLVGLVLFFVSFPLLWWNEGRVDPSSIAKTAVQVKADASDGPEGKLVAVTAPLTPDGTLGDDELLQPGPYVRLEREVEMFAWVERVEKEEKKQVGGGSKVITRYFYEKKWTTHPESEESFEHPEGHENPRLTWSAQTWRAEAAKVGGYTIDLGEIQLPPARPVALSAKNVKGEGRLVGNFLFLGKGTLEAPALGDVRISFRAIEGGRQVTAYGEKRGATLTTYVHQGKHALYRAVDGTHQEAVATLHNEHTTLTWVLRLVGFLFMWLGLALMLGPLHAAFDILPFLGSTSRFLAGVVLFPVALVLTGVTVLTSILAHNPYLLLAVVIGALGGGLFWVLRARARKRARGRITM